MRSKCAVGVWNIIMTMAKQKRIEKHIHNNIFFVRGWDFVIFGPWDYHSAQGRKIMCFLSHNRCPLEE